MMLMAAATDLLVIFLALEVLSLSVYVLTGLRRSSAHRRGSGLQVLPARRVLERLLPLRHRLRLRRLRLDPARSARRRDASQGAGAPPTLALLAVGLLAVGFCVQGLGGAVPHVDARTPTRARRRSSPRSCPPASRRRRSRRSCACSCRRSNRCKAQWVPVLSVIAAATMILGTVVGVVQTNIKRMLAYSSIAHAGYLLLGIIAANATGKAAVLFYLLAYAVTNLGALGIVALLGTPQHPHDELRDFAGLWQSRPALAGADDDVPALARRLPADRRLHRQVVHLRGRGRARLLLAGDHRRAHQRRLGLLLPAHHRDDVHDREAARRPARGCRSRRWPASAWRCSRSSTSASSPPRSSTSPSTRSRRSCRSARFRTRRPDLRSGGTAPGVRSAGCASRPMKVGPPTAISPRSIRDTHALLEISGRKLPTTRVPSCSS